jgi:hypothetical protein
MPPWVTAFLVLVLVVAFGTCVIYCTEGFQTSETKCKEELSKCQKACGSNDGACFEKCSITATKCYSDAVAAATIANSGSLNKPFTNSTLSWVGSTAPGMLGTGSMSNGIMSWTNSAGSSTSIPVYNTDLSRVYRNTAGLWSNTWPMFTTKTPTVTPSATPTPSKTPSATPSTTASQTASPTPKQSLFDLSSWDVNKDWYSSGWPTQKPKVDSDDSYDPSLPLEGSYIIQVKKWKPHEIPTEEKGVTVTAPTDTGTEAEEIRSTTTSVTTNVRGEDDELAPSLKQLIRDDVKYTIDALFKNEYEIQYT